MVQIVVCEKEISVFDCRLLILSVVKSAEISNLTRGMHDRMVFMHDRTDFMFDRMQNMHDKHTNLNELRHLCLNKRMVINDPAALLLVYNYKTKIHFSFKLKKEKWVFYVRNDHCLFCTLMELKLIFH